LVWLLLFMSSVFEQVKFCVPIQHTQRQLLDRKNECLYFPEHLGSLCTIQAAALTLCLRDSISICTTNVWVQPHKPHKRLNPTRKESGVRTLSCHSYLVSELTGRLAAALPPSHCLTCSPSPRSRLSFRLLKYYQTKLFIKRGFSGRPSSSILHEPSPWAVKAKRLVKW